MEKGLRDGAPSHTYTLQFVCTRSARNLFQWQYICPKFDDIKMEKVPQDGTPHTHYSFHVGEALDTCFNGSNFPHTSMTIRQRKAHKMERLYIHTLIYMYKKR